MDVKDTYTDEDSESAYVTSSDSERSSSHDDAVRTTPRAVYRSASTNTKSINSKIDENRLPDDVRPSYSSMSLAETRKIREDAVEWASNFQEPRSVHDIKSPTRHPPGARNQRKIEKRQAEQPASELRAKRLRGFHNSEYRELLNIEIRNASERIIPEDYDPLETSQVGSSVWTSKEKDTFFSALSRVGRDDVRKTGLRIGSKSAVEVHEYVHALQQATEERVMEDGKGQRLITFIDHPAAFEISEECCSVLERAGDAISNRQESYEEQAEEAKWGDIWLLTTSISNILEKKIKTEYGEAEMGEILPAANLFNLKNWLDLSHDVFMNPASPREEDNWHNIAEPGETPAIRATAFEDFYSLAVSLTRRLISSTLFCTMARLHITNANKIKHAEVSIQDVDAAVKILGLESNRIEYWRKCPRRCTLDIFDESHSNPQEAMMAYDEVELALGKEACVRSRSRSQSTKQLVESGESFSDVDDRLDSEELSDLDSQFKESSSYDDLIYPQPSEPDLEDHESLGITEDELTNRSNRRGESLKKRIEEAEINECAQEEYTERFDEEADRIEEQRLWSLLRQTPPFEIKLEPIDISNRPKLIRDRVEGRDWREKLEYWSQWEILPTLIPAEAFARTRELGLRGAHRTRSLSSRTASTDVEMDYDASGDDRPETRNYLVEQEQSDTSQDKSEQTVDDSEEGGVDDTDDRPYALQSPPRGAGERRSLELEATIKSEDEE